MAIRSTRLFTAPRFTAVHGRGSRPVRTRLLLVLLGAGVSVAVLGGCRNPDAIGAAEQSAPAGADGSADGAADGAALFAVLSAPAGAPGNFLCATEGVYTGALPDDDALDALQALGVVTVISVDAGRPRVEALEARGMRSVHIPISYGRMDARSEMMLAKAVRELPGPVYIHCHHGKHRGPSAAAVALRQLGVIDAEEAHGFLVAAHTSPNYEGLWRSVAQANERDPIELDRLISDFPAIAPVPNFPRAMAESETVKEHLDLLRDGGWGPLTDHPDLVAVSEAGRMADLFRALADREAEARATGETVLDEDFLVRLRRSAQDASDLEALLIARPVDATRADEVYTRLVADCKSCHDAYRQ